jgi:hypothetical protein
MDLFCYITNKHNLGQRLRIYEVYNICVIPQYMLLKNGPIHKKNFMYYQSMKGKVAIGTSIYTPMWTCWIEYGWINMYVLLNTESNHQYLMNRFGLN